MDTPQIDAQDVGANIVRALVLYSLAEFQSGNATTIRVSADGLSFEVSDNGRGHAIDRTIGDLPYLDFVYTHLEFPFGQSNAHLVQAHAIGLSFINSLCSQLAVTVRKNNCTLTRTYRNGRFSDERRFDVESPETGTVIAGLLNPNIPQAGIDLGYLRQWLVCVANACPDLNLSYNDEVMPSSIDA